MKQSQRTRLSGVFELIDGEPHLVAVNVDVVGDDLREALVQAVQRRLHDGQPIPVGPTEFK